MGELSTPVPDYLLNISATTWWGIQSRTVAPVVQHNDRYWYAGKDSQGCVAGNYPETWLNSFLPLYRHPGPYDPALMTVGRWCECRDGKVRQIAEISKWDDCRWEVGNPKTSIPRRYGHQAGLFDYDVIHILVTEAEKEAIEAMQKNPTQPTPQFRVMFRSNRGNFLTSMAGCPPFASRVAAEKFANERAPDSIGIVYVVVEELSEHTAEQPKPVVNVTRFRPYKES